MNEKNIIPVDDINIEPETVYVDFDKETLKQQVKTERMRKILDTAVAVYFQPYEKDSPAPGRHFIASAKWGESIASRYERVFDGMDSFFPEDYKYRKTYLKAKAGLDKSLETVNSDPDMQIVYGILSKSHEETHRTQFIRFGRLDMEDVLAAASERSFERKAELRNAIGNLDALLEAQARSTIYIEHRKNRPEQKALFAEINLSACAVFLAEVDDGVTLLKTIYNDIRSGDITPKESKRYETAVTPHMLSDIIIIAREPDLIDEIEKGIITYDELEAKVVEGLELLLTSPEDLISEITSKEFVIGVDQSASKI
ncbi:hypothetical protein A3A69_01120 [candidate division WWE3 bacterium RIFCSPLOWO2_01_FULL_37_15]|uniref:Uncharacterized protein n=1 Tax=candidate division WWE3 bacterium RIFCSPLOWO2_01_FULL_37_15 TaxID=1802622 RepID=A0A1F4V1R3_UNCKA|nr:MAG: hypothetical protein A3A69_01120 [candidate division WWE3 bacterium RIFCSPLOWO2_01_FULL_37_15]